MHENLSPYKEFSPPNEKLPPSIWALSLSTFWLNCSSVIVFGCSPVLLIRCFGFKEVDAGILEGTVEGFALIIRALTGMFSDFVGKRKAFLMWGYSISAFARLLLAPTSLVNVVIASRFAEKLGNGLQASPREAFISDITPPHLLGRAYGLNKTLGMAGSFTGAFLMLVSVIVYGQSFDVRLLLWGAGLMALISPVVLFYGVKEAPLRPLSENRRFSWRRQVQEIFKDMQQFSPLFWKTLGIIFLFKFGYFSGAFLIYLLKDSHATFFGLPLHGDAALASATFLVVQNLSCTLLTYPFGLISDKVDRRFGVALGFVFMIISLICFAYSGNSYFLYAGVILYGMQLGMQGALMALLSNTMPPHLHGTGFGIFFIASGVSVILANQIFMRNLLKAYGNSAAFLSIAVFILLALILLMWPSRAKKTQEAPQTNKKPRY